ncbi:hypothetical protein RFI_06421 [Reticulomyxa filosa]|uniref:Uncharacterized protein n=1 Tax=Reticulomyxa filosa TaxID=46433 RepID=X6NXZ5_RETFI|nr:hypothetical protein RFI_06421 [Reticulomyxa filosa]|eukprot:ETO30699.1 hypothetical protein RFI_06421 [Reticulomyxa filosa]
MKERGVTMNPLIAEKLMNACFGGDSFDQNKLNDLLRELDKIKSDFNTSIGNITIGDLSNPLEAKMMMKRVLLAASVTI